jgi:hypothetical protein
VKDRHHESKSLRDSAWLACVESVDPENISE